MSTLHIHFFNSQILTVYLNPYKVILSGSLIFSILFSNQVFSVEQSQTTASLEHLNTEQRQLLSSMQSTNEEERIQAAQALQNMAQSNKLTRLTAEELKKLMKNNNIPLYVRTKAVIILHYTSTHSIPSDLIFKMKEHITNDRHKLTILNLLDELLHQRLSLDSIYNIGNILIDSVEKIIFTNSRVSKLIRKQATDTLAHIIVQFFHLNLEMIIKDSSINDIFNMLNDLIKDEKQSEHVEEAAKEIRANLIKYQKKYNVISPSKQCSRSFSQ